MNNIIKYGGKIHRIFYCSKLVQALIECIKEVFKMVIVNTEQIAVFHPIIKYLPKRLRKYIIPLKLTELEEIRLRKGLKLSVIKNSKAYYVSEKGTLSEHDDLGVIVNGQDIEEAMELICESSLYAVEESIKEGYITLSGGHRIGISGSVAVHDKKVIAIKNISSMNYRISREICGISDYFIDKIYDGNRVLNTLIISPPGCGKTTLLRDITRNLSQKKVKISVADERNEISAMHNGNFGYNLGNMCDVLEGAKKSDAMLMLLRTMSPEVIVTDELGMDEDFYACTKAINSGVETSKGRCSNGCIPPLFYSNY